MAAILDRMKAGFAGDVTRKSASIIESGVMASDMAYGTPVTLANGKFDYPKTKDDVIYGFIVRPYPTQATLAEEGKINGCMRSGYMTVLLANGTAGKGNPVYVRIMDSGTKKIGDIEASVSTVSVQGEDGEAAEPESILIPDCFFMGEADADGIVEITYNV